MNDIPLSLLVVGLVILLACSAFFSGSETALMMLNRYRLLHRVKQGHTGAIKAQTLLQRPDRLIGFLLLGNNFVNILASAISTLIALRLMGENGIAVAAGILTLLVLIFAELAPKTLAARHPERLGYPAARVILPLLRVFQPLVWVINAVANTVLHALVGAGPATGTATLLNKEELRTLVTEAGAFVSDRYHTMLLSVLDLESATVRDIMVPRNEIVGLDLEIPFEQVVAQLRASRHTRLPVYRRSIDKVFGVLHLRNALLRMTEADFSRDSLMKSVGKAYFVPEQMPLHKLLQSFKRENLRMGLVVDEYGDVLGLVTLEDLLQEIVGEFSGDSPEVLKQKDGTYLVDAGISLRELNRITGWSLPTEGPKTLNGLIIEYLETIPEPGVSLKLCDLRLEVTKMESNVIRQVRFYP